MLQKYILHNDEILESSASSLKPGQVGALSGWGVFSTLRVASGVLFEFPRHFQRMKRDAALLRVPFPASEDWIETRLVKLVEANRISEATLRVIVLRNKGSIWEGPGIERDFDLIAFTTKLTNWGTGVKLGIVPQARHAGSPFAGTKVLSWAFNLTWYEEAHERGLDEVVLLNERDEVAECTSANIFIAEGDRLWTPPLTSGCLPGVTRDLLLHAVETPGYSIGEKPLRLEDLERADGVFITSTTRDVLPVAEIEGLQIHQNPEAASALRAAFRSYLDAYVAGHSRAAVL